MLSFDARTLALTALLALTACGFTPALGPDGTAETLRGSIDIADPADVEGFALVRQLEQRLGQSNGGPYRLDAEIAVNDQGVGILPDQTITRFQVVGTVDYTLTALATEAAVKKGRVSNFTSYSATSTTVATTAAQRDARERLMISLADQIVADLTLTRSEWAQ